MTGDLDRGAANRAATLSLAIAYLGFISLGLPDPVAGVAWPSVRATFALHQSSFGLIFIGLGCGYCASGFFGGKFTHLLGLGNLLWISSTLVAAAMLASGLAPVWSAIVGGAVLWGLGSGGIDAGLNSYVSTHFSARHMNWLHACYSLGATLGPLVMTAMVAGVGSWRLGYGVVGGVMSLMSILFLVTRRRWDVPPTIGFTPAEGAAARPTEVADRVGLLDTLRRPLVQLQTAIFFLYVGLEFTVGQWSYTLLTESRGLSEERSGSLAAAYYGAIGLGRIVAGVIAPRVGLDRLLRTTMIVALLGAAYYAFGRAPAAGSIGLLLIGLGLAPVFPCLMTQTPGRVGASYAAHAVGFQVSAGMLGAALVPSATGLLVDRYGLEVAAVFAVALAAALLISHETVLLLIRSRRSEKAQ